MNEIKKYFEVNAKQWVLDGYSDDGYNYPVALHRARIISKCVSKMGKRKLTILDLGCGGGNLTFMLAQKGHTVVGVDQSQKMIDLAESRCSASPKSVQDRTQFIHTPIEAITLGKKFDVIIAMGLIGYLPTDKILFNIANRLLKSKGHFLVSCRNRLFNMASISFGTKKEIKSRGALALIDELQELHHRIPVKSANEFIANYKRIAAALPAHASFNKKLMLSPSEKHSPDTPASNFEPRQNSPRQLKKSAAMSGFTHKAYYGVHPHLLDPNLNRLLPPQIFNKISASLEAFEHLPISLVWSSVFIGVFQKIK